MLLHVRQESLHLPRLFLESFQLLGVPGKIFCQLIHLLVKISLGGGCDSQVISELLQLDSRVSSNGVQGCSMLVLQILSALAAKTFHIVLFGA